MTEAPRAGGTLPASPCVLFEVGWEVCNKVGGLHAVIASKARSLVERFGDGYVAVGPWLLSHREQDSRFEDEPGFESFAESCRRAGVPVRVGRWLVPGRPRTILVEFTGLLADRDAYLARLWEEHRVDSLLGGWSYLEPAHFGRAAGMVIEKWWREVSPRGLPALLHAHEWLAGTALLHVQRRMPAWGTVFTAHATVLGRSLAASGRPGARGLDGRTPEEAARELGVPAKHSLEGVTARTADVFSTVSPIAAEEAEVFHRRRPTPILPNGLDFRTLDEAGHKTDRTEARRRLRDVASSFLGVDVGDALLIATSGPYELHNKGLDVLLEAGAKLQQQPGKPILLFLFVAAGASGPRLEMLSPSTSGAPVRRDPSIVATHHLFDPERDEIQAACRRLGLDNAPDRRVKVLHVPIYLREDDDFLELTYEAAIRAVDVTCFPALYEPWGMSPLESLALGVATVTTDRTGFAAWMRAEEVGETAGLWVLRRGDDDFATARELGRLLERFSQRSPAAAASPEACREAVARLDWSHLISRHYAAYEVARDEASKRSRQAPPEPMGWTAPPISSRMRGQIEPRLHTYEVAGPVPVALERLAELARNYRWTWDAGARRVFEELAPHRWRAAGRNPVRFLGDVARHGLDEPAGTTVNQQLEAALSRLRQSIEAPVDPACAEANLSWRRPVAYFSAEFGVESSLQTYTGGLGILAGDHLKTASDLGVPLVGVGLFYHRGYLRQRIGRHGEQLWSPAPNDPRSHALEPLEDEDGAPLQVRLPFPGGQVVLHVWRAMVGKIPLYLLDADVPANRPEDRSITHYLYGGDEDLRVRQEIVLGRGGVRLLDALDIDPAVVHINEGHAAFAPLERVSELVRNEGLVFEEAREVVRASTVFTTHTPVAAGHDRFGEDLMRRYFYDIESWLGLPWERFFALGTSPGDPEGFAMTRLAVQLARYVNGVSRLHRVVSQELLQETWPGLLADEVPVHHVTNGVHLDTWTAADIRPLHRSWSDVDAPTPAPSELWRAHLAARRRFLEGARRRLRRSAEARGDPPELIERVLRGLDEKALLVGFARRFAPYKRAHLLLRERERLHRILSRSDRPVRLFFAGKAHPRDGHGQEILQLVAQAATSGDLAGQVFFLEDYDIELATMLVQGVDLWLNTPTRGLEASGTSGMKAAANGLLNLSVLDGWWPEAWDGSNGWTITGGDIAEDPELVDELDCAEVLRLLEGEITSLFFERDADGLPRGWIERMVRSMKTAVEGFGSERMLRQYRDWAYLDAARRHFRARDDDYASVRAEVQRMSRLRRLFPELRVLDVRLPEPGSLEIGRDLVAAVDMELGQLDPGDLAVELLLGRPGENGQLEERRIVPLEVESDGERAAPGVRRFRARTHLEAGGRWACGIRLRVRAADPPSPALSDLVMWL